MSADQLPARVTPYLAVAGAAEALEFYVRAFGAVEISRIVNDDGTIGHAELRIGQAAVFVSDEWAAMNVRSPKSLGGYSVSLVIEVADARAMVKELETEGATVERPIGPGPEEGTVAAWVIDPYGHRWFISSPG